MGLLDPFPRPQVRRPVRHRFALPVRLIRGIPPTVVSRRREEQAFGSGTRLSPPEAQEPAAQRIGETIRQRLLDLRRGFPAFPGCGAWRVRP
jgi:hypothetical protein